MIKDVFAIELFATGKKLYYCQYELLGEKNVKMVHHQYDALLYTEKELNNVMPDLKTFLDKRSGITMSIRKIEKPEKEQFKSW